MTNPNLDTGPKSWQTFVHLLQSKLPDATRINWNHNGEHLTLECWSKGTLPWTSYIKHGLFMTILLNL